MTQVADPRTEALSQAINRYLMSGYVLVSRDENTAVVSRPARKPNHLLHFFLSLFSVGLWLPVWILLSIFQRREKRVMLRVDMDGRVREG